MMTFDLKTTVQPNIEVSPQHKKLNRLIESIEQQKLLLAEWENAKSEIQQYAGQKLMPAYHQLNQVLYQQLEQLWNSLSRYEFSQSDLAQLDEKIHDLALSLQSNQTMSEQQSDLIEQIIVFYQQKSEQEELKRTKSIKQNQHFHQNQNAHDDLEQSSADVSGLGREQTMDQSESWDWEHDFDQQQNLHRQAREQAKLNRKQDKQAQAEKMSEQSLKSVYLKIASIIHPDREPDEAKKAEKTELLQRANEAYEQQDLFYLLKLQLEVEQQKLNKKALSDEQLKFYQMALESQSFKLQNQIDVLIDRLIWSQKAKIAVQKAKRQLNINDLYEQIDADVSAIKHQLKAEKQRLMYIGKKSGLEMLLEHGVL